MVFEVSTSDILDVDVTVPVPSVPVSNSFEILGTIETKDETEEEPIRK